MELIVDYLIDYAGTIYPYLGVFLALLICGLGVPIPEDIILFAAGLLSYYGVVDVWTIILVGLLGVLLGDSFIFWLGHHYGRKLLKRWPFSKFIHESQIEGVRQKLHNRGGRLLFSARFMPGVRSTVFFASGLLHFPYWKMLTYDGIAALISVPAIVYGVFYFGDIYEHAIRWIKKVEGGIAGLILGVVLFFIVRYWLKHRKGEAKGEI
jgi:membrane protein DedA with SNARE-associated domain